ncbi:hypothetical protein Pmani_012356 [Petrolisthes manimaculis]|uniref:Uncharacterized protein n=1 Tax=Petrolisthes manimaculis TaxID=1843537 RepID=A0AAE1PZG4_9EUCA|nr:hypothetical protein Pmani_012356 [Petrolisthes manimaculis]
MGIEPADLTKTPPTRRLPRHTYIPPANSSLFLQPHSALHTTSKLVPLPSTSLSLTYHQQIRTSSFNLTQPYIPPANSYLFLQPHSALHTTSKLVPLPSTSLSLTYHQQTRPSSFNLTQPYIPPANSYLFLPSFLPSTSDSQLLIN